jgi:beta-phosphoglucomutase-like phosphatase (HAD superfamily)
MQLNTVIFDMDGLLIDSEPYWQEAGIETLQHFNVSLTLEQYHATTGLRTREWIQYWFNFFEIDPRYASDAESTIVAAALQKIRDHALPMPGTEYIFPFFEELNFTIGLATSSPVELIDVVVDKLNIRKYFNGFSSAENLPHSKPHPAVFLNCAEILQRSPLECICFEDSFNGMIAAKAARMKCVAIPAPDVYAQPKWEAADLKLKSLSEFNREFLIGL